MPLIVRPEAHPDAPVMVCGLPGCDWALSLGPGESAALWDLAVEHAQEELEKHRDEAHSPATEALSWEVALVWCDAVDETAPPEPARGDGPPWEPFAAWPLERAGIPGTTIAWRRGR